MSSRLTRPRDGLVVTISYRTGDEMASYVSITQITDKPAGGFYVYAEWPRPDGGHYADCEAGS